MQYFTMGAFVVVERRHYKVGDLCSWIVMMEDTVEADLWLWPIFISQYINSRREGVSRWNLGTSHIVLIRLAHHKTRT